MEKFDKHERLNIANKKHLTVARHIKEADYPLHWHSFFEVEIIISGKGKCVINDIEFDILPNSVFLLSTTDFHHLKVDETTEIINISFDEELIDEETLLSIISPETKKNYVLTEAEHKRLVSASELLEYECRSDGECQKHLLQYILTSILNKNDNKHTDFYNNNRYSGIKKAIIYMEIHFKEKITLEILSKESGYHPAYFSELFKKATGETYIATLNKLRTGYARTLLANGFSVSQTCFLSGFSSLSNFGSIFKKYMNMSPREYAEKSKNKM